MRRTVRIINSPDEGDPSGNDYYLCTVAANLLGITDRTMRRYLHTRKVTPTTVYLLAQPDGSVVASLDKPTDRTILSTRVCVPASQVHQRIASRAVAV